MKIILQESTNPYFNIATEEYLLKNFSDDFTLLYRNSPSIIVGKHQNALAEINHQYTLSKKIPVIRRISGGGTVFHDLGNLNFSFILNSGKNPVNFRKYTQPVLDYLIQLGIQAEFSPRNDIFIQNKKVSGNAEHIFKNRVLHHGTLLYNSMLENLNRALNVHTERYNSKAIQSVKREVTNISNFLASTTRIETFNKGLFKYLQTFFLADIYTLNRQNEEQIENLCTKKYKTREWNFGYSPNYHFKNSFLFKNIGIELNLDVKKGKIKKLTCILSPENTQQRAMFESLKSLWHYPEDIENKLNPMLSKTDVQFLVNRLF